MLTNRKVSVSLLSAFTASCTIASGADFAASASMIETKASQIELLTNKIAKKEIELLRLNTNFRRECTKVSKWKPWRLFLYNLGASGCSNAGITHISATRWHYWPTPRNMSRKTAKTGPTLLLIGHCITLGGVLTEAALDQVNDYKVRQKGFDIKTTHKRVLEIKDELDRLLAERNALVDQAQELSAAELRLAKAEGAVLADVRDLGLSEYGQFYVRANKFFTSRDVNSLMATTAASTGGFQGSLLGIISAAKRDPRLVGPGGLGFVISGAAIIATPPTMRIASNIRGHFAKEKINSQLTNISTKTVAKLNEDRAVLQNAVTQEYPSQSEPAKLVQRLGAYEKQSSLFAAQDAMNKAERKLVNKEFLERMTAASIVGGTKMSWGINLANAGYRFEPQVIPRLQVDNKTKQKKIVFVNDPSPARMFTHRVAVGSTTYIPGTGFWILDTLQNRIRGEMRNHKLASNKQAPAYLLKERYDRLDEIDGVFNY